MDDKSINLWRQIDACRRGKGRRHMPSADERPAKRASAN
jgi:hypothetical protein